MNNDTEPEVPMTAGELLGRFEDRFWVTDGDDWPDHDSPPIRGASGNLHWLVVTFASGSRFEVTVRELPSD